LASQARVLDSAVFTLSASGGGNGALAPSGSRPSANAPAQRESASLPSTRASLASNALSSTVASAWRCASNGGSAPSV